MRIYFDTSALNRPFDDLTAERVRLEAEAIAALLAAVEDGRLEWIVSDYLVFEISRTPDQERAHRVQALLRSATRTVRVSARLLRRARRLETLGLRGLDALHIAAAEAGNAELLVTTDDRMMKRARRAGANLTLRIVDPHDALRALKVGGA